MNTFNSSILEAEVGESLSMRPARSTEEVPGQPVLATQRNSVSERGRKSRWEAGRKRKEERGIDVINIR